MDLILDKEQTVTIDFRCDSSQPFDLSMVGEDIDFINGLDQNISKRNSCFCKSENQKEIQESSYECRIRDG